MGSNDGVGRRIHCELSGGAGDSPARPGKAEVLFHLLLLVSDVITGGRSELRSGRGAAARSWHARVHSQVPGLPVGIEHQATASLRQVGERDLMPKPLAGRPSTMRRVATFVHRQVEVFAGPLPGEEAGEDGRVTFGGHAAVIVASDVARNAARQQPLAPVSQDFHAHSVRSRSTKKEEPDGSGPSRPLPAPPGPSCRARCKSSTLRDLDNGRRAATTERRRRARSISGQPLRRGA